VNASDFYKDDFQLVEREDGLGHDGQLSCHGMNWLNTT
jgi:hypothetical protein